MANRIKRRCLLLLLLCGVLSPIFAQEAGETVRIQGTINEDVYAAGGKVDILAAIEGDVVAAGGHVTVTERISGDVMVAGAAVSVRADIGDDVRLAGGDITLSGTVGDDAIAAGGNITLMRDARVGGRTWFSGGLIDVAGTVGEELKASGGRIIVSGRVNGNVELTGRDISILDSAIIDGDLLYRSPQEAEIAGGAQIRGTITYEPVEQPVVATTTAAAGMGIVFLLSLMLTGGALFLIFPNFIGTAMTTIHAEPWKCLGLGLAVFAATPVAISALFFTIIGWLPAMIIAAVYLVLLLAGYLTGVFYVGHLGLKLLGRGETSKAQRLWSFVIALIVLTLLGLVPLLGSLLLFALLLLGVGVLNLSLYRIYASD